MTKARDLANIISGGFTVSDLPTLTATEIPNLDTAKITTGELANARIAALPASKITTGTFADARISASSVSQHATSFDDNKIINDLGQLALHQSINENKAAYSLQNMFVDQFQDDTGLDVQTTCDRNASEYMSSVVLVASGLTVSKTGSPTHRTDKYKWGSSSIDVSSGNNVYIDTGGDGGIFDLEAGNFTAEYWVNLDSNDAWTVGLQLKNTAGNEYMDYIGYDMSGSRPTHYYYRAAGANITNLESKDHLTPGWWSITTGSWHHVAIERTGAYFSFYLDGTRLATASRGAGALTDLQRFVPNASQNGAIDDCRLSNVARYDASTYTVPSARLTNDANTLCLIQSIDQGNGTSVFTDYGTKGSTLTVNATGNFTSVNKTANATVNTASIIVLYTDAGSGASTLNTDLVAAISSNGGTNYTNATLVAKQDFATGIKMAIANDVTIATAQGTSMKYKISFANQASGTKETQIKGVALLY